MEKGIWADNNKRGGLRKDLMAMSREEMWTSDGNWERLKEPTSGTGDWIGNWRRLSKKSNCSKGWEMPFMTWIKSLLGITGNGAVLRGRSSMAMSLHFKYSWVNLVVPKNWVAYFSAISGQKFDLTTVLRSCWPIEWHRRSFIASGPRAADECQFWTNYKRT